MNMKPTKAEVNQFLESLQWERMTKKELEKKLQEFFHVTNTLSDGTCEDCKDIDYSFFFTDATEECAGYNFIDVEIYYLKMRQRNHILITGTDLLDYVE